MDTASHLTLAMPGGLLSTGQHWPVHGACPAATGSGLSQMVPAVLKDDESGRERGGHSLSRLACPERLPSEKGAGNDQRQVA